MSVRLGTGRLFSVSNGAYNAFEGMAVGDITTFTGATNNGDCRWGDVRFFAR